MKFPLGSISINEISNNESPILKNLAQFYVYDVSKECHFSVSENGLYEPLDFSQYFEDPQRKSFFIYVNQEIAGFILVNKAIVNANSEWTIGEFFVMTKFQNNGVGTQALSLLWETMPGVWDICVLPNNQRALSFWKHISKTFSKVTAREELREVDFDPSQPKRVVFQVTV